MTIEEMIIAKKRLNLTNQELAEKSGVPVSTVAKILGGTTRNPHPGTIRALESVLQTKQESYGTIRPVRPSHVAETSVVYGTSPQKDSTESDDLVMQPHYNTLQDYLSLPPDKRVELIDGKFYDLAAPGGIHQLICSLIWHQLFLCIEEHEMSCIAQIAPFDVLLDADAYTVVEPDVMVFCRNPREALKVRAGEAPDFICEVLSPSTAFRDRHLKLFKYSAAGVREVWLVDPLHKVIEVYDFKDTEEPHKTYTFSDVVPVKLSGGKCSIDFRMIDAKLAAWE